MNHTFHGLTKKKKNTTDSKVLSFPHPGGRILDLSTSSLIDFGQLQHIDSILFPPCFVDLLLYLDQCPVDDPVSAASDFIRCFAKEFLDDSVSAWGLVLHQ